MVGMPMPRYDLLKKNRYVNRTFVQTSRGCHQGCTFCAEPLMNGLKFRYRPVDEVIHEMENCGARTISINDADFFGTPERPKEVMRALKGRGFQWQAGVTSKLAQDDRMLELAAESGCTMLSIGFESISRSTLTERAQARQPAGPIRRAGREDAFLRDHGVRPVHVRLRRRRSVGVRRDREFNIEANYDACAYSALTPYPGTLTWYEMKRANRIVSFDWTMYDQGHVVYRPAQMEADELRVGLDRAYEELLFAVVDGASRFPLRGKRHRTQWAIYNAFMRKASRDRKHRSRSRRRRRRPDRRADAADPADQARMARGRAGSRGDTPRGARARVEFRRAIAERPRPARPRAAQAAISPAAPPRAPAPPAAPSRGGPRRTAAPGHIRS